MEITLMSATWPGFNTFKEFKLVEAMYDFDDEARANLRCQRLYKDRQNPLECLAAAEIHKKF